MLALSDDDRLERLEREIKHLQRYLQSRDVKLPPPTPQDNPPGSTAAGIRMARRRAGLPNILRAFDIGKW
jgi:hypothetical protein